VQRSPSPLDEDDLEDFETWKRIVRVIGLIDARASGNDRRIRTEDAQPFAHADELPSSPLMRYLANQLTAGPWCLSFRRWSAFRPCEFISASVNSAMAAISARHTQHRLAARWGDAN
jgi:hypothetical protein